MLLKRGEQEQLAEAVLDHRQIRRQVISLAWPVAAQMAVQTMAQVVDMAMVGRLGAASIAAVGLSFRPLFVVHAVLLGLGSGATALVARQVGARDQAGADRVLAQCFQMSLVLALVVAGGIYLLARGILRFMGAEDPVSDLGTGYIRALSSGFGALAIITLLTACLRGAGDTRTPMRASIIGNVLNVFGNWVLIFGHLGFPALGVFGAGLATSISRVFTVVLLVVPLVRGRTVLRLGDWRPGRVHGEILGRLLRISWPAAIERLNVSLAQAFHMRVVASLGTVPVAAATVATNVESLSFLPAIGFSVAAAALVGQSLGAGRPERAAQSAWTAARTGATFMGCMGILFAVFPRWLVRAFTSDSSVLAPASLLLRLMALIQIPTALAHTLCGGLRGAGDTRSVLFIVGVSAWVVRVGMALVMVRYLGWGLVGAWVAVVFDWLFQSGLSIWWFSRGRWKSIRV